MNFVTIAIDSGIGRFMGGKRTVYIQLHFLSDKLNYDGRVSVKSLAHSHVAAVM